jgi:hypothetical protein
VSRDVHIEGFGIGTEQVVMDGGNLEAARDHLGHDRVYLRVQQDKIAHDHGAAVGGLECDPAAECQCRLDRHAVQSDRKIAAWKSIAMYVSGDGGFSAEHIIDLLPADVLGMSRRDERFGEDVPVDFLRVRAGRENHR